MRFLNRLRDVASLSAAEIGERVAFALVGILVARKLGPSSFGTYVTAIALLRLGGVFANIGVGEVLLPRVTRDPANYARHAMSAITCSAVSFPLAAGLIIGIAAAMQFDQEIIGIVLAGTIMILFEILSGIGTALCQLQRKFILISSAALIRTLVSCGLTLACLAKGLPTKYLVLSYVVGWVLGTFAYVSVFLQVIKLRVLPFRLKDFVLEAFPFGASCWLSYLYIQGDLLIIAALMGKGPAAYYAAGMRLPLLFVLFSSSLYKILIPKMFDMSMKNRVQLKRLLEVAWGALVLVCLGVCVGGSLVAGPLINFLFGPEYTPAIPVFRVGIWVFLLFALATTVGQTLTSLYLQKRKPLLQAIIFAVKILLLLALLPRIGVVGGAWATVICTSALAILYAGFVWRKLGAFRMTEGVWRSVLAATAMGIVVWVCAKTGMHVMVNILIGGACYIIAVFVLGGWNWLHKALASIVDAGSSTGRSLIEENG